MAVKIYLRLPPNHIARYLYILTCMSVSSGQGIVPHAVIKCFSDHFMMYYIDLDE